MLGGKVRASRRWSRSIVISERLAIAMVVGGIGGEGIFEYLAARAENAVRELDERMTTSAQKSAVAALKEANGALAENKAEIDARIALEKQLLSQGHRAAIFHDPSVNDRLVARLKPFAGQKFEIQYCPFTDKDFEQYEVLVAVEFLLEYEAHWDSLGRIRSGMCAAEIFVMVRSTAPAKTQQAADALMDELVNTPGLPLADLRARNLSHSAMRSQEPTPPAKAGVEPSSADIVLIYVGPHP